MSEDLDTNVSLDDNLSGASLARQKIVDQINSLDVSKFDITPWENPNRIIPLPKQEEFFKSKAQITFYGG